MKTPDQAANRTLDNNKSGSEKDPEIKSFEDQYEDDNNAYIEELHKLLNDGWRDSSDSPGLRVGSPNLEHDARDMETGQTLPDGAKQTVIHVLNRPVAWGDSGWFVKDGVHSAPGPDYKVVIREAKDGKWMNPEGFHPENVW